MKIKPLGLMIGAFIPISGKQINLLRSTPGVHVWQRSFYEPILRNQSELEDIATYICANPIQWLDDNDTDPWDNKLWVLEGGERYATKSNFP